MKDNNRLTHHKIIHRYGSRLWAEVQSIEATLSVWRRFAKLKILGFWGWEDTSESDLLWYGSRLKTNPTVLSQPSDRSRASGGSYPLTLTLYQRTLRQNPKREDNWLAILTSQSAGSANEKGELTRQRSSCTLSGSGSDAGGAWTLSQFSLFSTACSHCSNRP